MTPFNPEVHHRQSIRLSGYPYTLAGAYFLTLCSHHRECLFGEIVDSEVRLSAYGQIVSDEWLRPAAARLNVALDAFVVMPNHLHAILILNDPVQISQSEVAARPVGATRRVAPTPGNPSAPSRPNGPSSQSVGAVVGQFKSIVTKRINTLRNAPSLSVWQRNYYEHIIRDAAELNRIRAYIADNPAHWTEDENHPTNVQPLVGATRRVAPTTPTNLRARSGTPPW